MPSQPQAHGLSRRAFGQLLGLGAAALAFPPTVSAEAVLGAAARPIVPRRRRTAGAPVRLDSNEHPLGPCAPAQTAVAGLGAASGRYAFRESEEFAARWAAIEGVGRDHLTVFAGSSDPLHRAVLALSGPGRAVVTVAPGYEAAVWGAAASGAPVREVPLRTGDFAHDVRAMLAAGMDAGVFYVVNPNNPTGTATPLADIEWLVAHKPAGSVVLVDEAYIHFSDEPSTMHLVRQGADVIVLRTFSKLYGMAGLRLGGAFARPDLLQRLDAFGRSPLPAPGVLAGLASLDDRGLVPRRRDETRRAREATYAALERLGVPYRPSVSNCFMFDAGRPGRELAQALAERGVLVGRSWPAWPTWVRVTVGTEAEMQAFARALGEVIDRA